MSERTDFTVGRKDWGDTRFESHAAGDLQAGQVRLRVDRFALTSNNISYAASGDMLGYWGFFPAEQGRGRIPVMGLGDVLESANPDVAEGTRVFGFFPMSNEHVVDAVASRGGFSDGGAHRAEHSPIYRQFGNVALDANYTVETEDQIILFRGLFMTSFLVDDFVADNDHFGSERLLISSASSKTSIALAHCAKLRGHSSVLGFTSAGNLEFTRKLGCYDEVLLYDDIESIYANTASVFVDMAGNGDVVSRIHHHLGETLKHDCVIGATHWDKGRAADGLPGPKREFFFAPSQMVKRSKDWGPDGLQQRMGQSWESFVEFTNGWLKVVRGSGPDALDRVYQETLAGKIDPTVGNVLSL
jgi:hypothetical protein